MTQLLILVSFSCLAQNSEIDLNGKTYSLAFFDEFNTEKIDESKWTYRTDSKHWSTQQKRNVEVKNGFLKLNVKKERSLGKEYTGAGIISIDTFKYGYYEARLKIPKGDGWHTSFWLMKHNRLGNTLPSTTEIEIDILENDSKNSNGYEIAFHKWINGHTSVFGQHVETPNMNKKFVIAACEYTADYVKYYVNGKEIKELDLTDLPTGSVNIWLTSIASHLGGTESVNDKELPSAAIIDYVRYYQEQKD